MRTRRTIIFPGAALVLAGVSGACGLATIGTGEPFYGSFDASGDRATGDDGAFAVDGAEDPDAGGAGDEAGVPSDAGAEGSSLDARADAIADAAPLCDPGMCGTAGGKCGAGNTCTIDCSKSGAGACTKPTCPAGHACVITCGGGFCVDGVDCAAATSCDIQCSGGGSCTKPITCGGASCSVACTGGGACTDDITCTASRCTITCAAGGACAKKIACAAAMACSVTCSNNATCPTLDVAAPDAAIACGKSTGGNDCNDVSCYADGGQCFIGCDQNDCQGAVCCSGKCTGTARGDAAATCP